MHGNPRQSSDTTEYVCLFIFFVNNNNKKNKQTVQWILHLWRDDECVKILKNCHRALPANGKVIVVEYVLPASPEPTQVAQVSLLLDVAMLNRLRGAKERTEQEFAQLAAEAGFSGGCRATYVFASAWALEFTK
jgi:caffeic acid 3-O-methyltransferase